MAARVKVIDLAKELGVTSKDLIVALEGMGHKGMRAMSPLLAATANELRVKLGRGRELPPEAKPKRAPRPKAAEGDAVAPRQVARERLVLRIGRRTYPGVERMRLVDRAGVCGGVHRAERQNAATLDRDEDQREQAKAPDR